MSGELGTPPTGPCESPQDPAPLPAYLESKERLNHLPLGFLCCVIWERRKQHKRYCSEGPCRLGDFLPPMNQPGIRKCSCLGCPTHTQPWQGSGDSSQHSFHNEPLTRPTCLKDSLFPCRGILTERVYWLFFSVL